MEVYIDWLKMSQCSIVNSHLKKQPTLCKTLAVYQQLVMVALKMEQNTDKLNQNQIVVCSAVVPLLYQPLAIIPVFLLAVRMPIICKPNYI